MYLVLSVLNTFLGWNFFTFWLRFLKNRKQQVRVDDSKIIGLVMLGKIYVFILIKRQDDVTLTSEFRSNLKYYN